MATDNFTTVYNDPTDSGSGSTLFESGEIPSPTKLNRWSDEITVAFIEIGRKLGDLNNIQPSTPANTIYAGYITNFLRAIGSMDNLSPIDPAGHVTAGATYEQILPNGEYSFELDFELSGSYNKDSSTPSGLLTVTEDLFDIEEFSTSPANLQPGQWWVDYEDSGSTRTFKGRRLVTGTISSNSPKLTFKASTGEGDYGSSDIYASTAASSRLFNVIPTVAQAEATIQSLDGAGGFAEITASTQIALHTISFENLYYTHYLDKDGEIQLHRLADTEHGTVASNAYTYKVPQFIIDAATNNGGIIPNGLVSLWKYYDTNTSQRVLQPALADIYGPSRDEFVFRVVDEYTITMQPTSTNDIEFRTQYGARCVVVFSALDITQALKMIAQKTKLHAHTGDDGSRPINHDDLILPTSDAHKASAIRITPPTGSNIFGSDTDVQDAIESLETTLNDHMMDAEAGSIPENRVHNDYSIKCTPAENLPNSDFDTTPFTNLYGDNLGRNLFLLDKHLDMTDTTTNLLHGAFRHHAGQIKMASDSEQSVYNFVNVEKSRLTSHIQTEATEVQPIHGMRKRPSRFGSTVLGNEEVLFEHGGGDVWGFGEMTSGGTPYFSDEVVLDANMDWRDRFIQITGVLHKYSTGDATLVVPGGASDSSIHGGMLVEYTSTNSPVVLNTTSPTAALCGNGFFNAFFYSSSGATIDLGTGSGNPVLQIGVTAEGYLKAILQDTSGFDTDTTAYMVYWKASYSPRTGKRALDASDPDYVYITNPYGSNQQTITIQLPNN